jgi:hypothetical protein
MIEMPDPVVKAAISHETPVLQPVIEDKQY